MTWAEVARLRARIKDGLVKLDPTLEGQLDHLPGVAVRALVNYHTGADVPNGPVLQTMRAMAEAVERAAGRPPPA